MNGFQTSKEERTYQRYIMQMRTHDEVKRLLRAGVPPTCKELNPRLNAKGLDGIKAPSIKKALRILNEEVAGASSEPGAVGNTASQVTTLDLIKALQSPLGITPIIVESTQASELSLDAKKQSDEAEFVLAIATVKAMMPKLDVASLFFKASSNGVHVELERDSLEQETTVVIKRRKEVL